MRRHTDGIAPRNGPKKGITFVTPTITAMSSASGMFSTSRHTYVRIPIIIASRILPTMNPINVSFIIFTNS